MKWEYKRERPKITFSLSRDVFLEFLAKEGEQGWELVAYQDSIGEPQIFNCIFKRRTDWFEAEQTDRHYQKKAFAERNSGHPYP